MLLLQTSFALTNIEYLQIKKDFLIECLPSPTTIRYLNVFMKCISVSASSIIDLHTNLKNIRWREIFSEKGGWGRRACEADQGPGQRRQVRQAEEGGAEEQEGRRQGEEVRMVDSSPSFSIKTMWKLKTGWLTFGLNTKRINLEYCRLFLELLLFFQCDIIEKSWPKRCNSGPR